jgi:hypothetical protein
VPGAQVPERAALDDAEERAPARRIGLAPRRLAALLPAGGALERFLVVVARRLRGRALVEGHEDVAAELQLQPGRLLRRQLLPAAVEVAAEDRALLADLALLGERVDLEAAGVGEEVALPGHEAVQAAHLPDEVGARPQHEMIGVAEDDLRPDLAQVVRRDGLDRGDGAHRHELRRVHLAVRQRELAPPGRAVGVGDLELHAMSIASP